MKRKKSREKFNAQNPDWVPAKEGSVVASGVDFGKGLTYNDVIDRKQNVIRRNWSNGTTTVWMLATEPRRFDENFKPIIYKRNPTPPTK